jgi:chaperonin cofactor prefoldin
MYESPSDTAQQLTAFLAILQSHRDQLAQQMEDIRVTLEEIEQHEERALGLLAEAGQTRMPVA